MLSSKTVNWSLFGRYFGLQKQTFNGTKKQKCIQVPKKKKVCMRDVNILHEAKQIVKKGKK